MCHHGIVADAAAAAAATDAIVTTCRVDDVEIDIDAMIAATVKPHEYDRFVDCRSNHTTVPPSPITSVPSSPSSSHRYAVSPPPEEV